MAVCWALLLCLGLVQVLPTRGDDQADSLKAVKMSMKVAAREMLQELKSEGADDVTLDLVRHESWQRKAHVSQAVLGEATRLQAALALYEKATANMADSHLLPDLFCDQKDLDVVQAVLNGLPQEGVVRPLTSVAVLQSLGCQQGSYQVAFSLLAFVQAAKSTQVASSPPRHRSYHCEELEECRTNGLSQVRALFSSEPDLLLLFDGVASSVFGAEDKEHLAQALADDAIEDLESEEVKVELRKRRSLVAMETEFRHRRGTCVNETEQKVQSVFSWIPFLGTLYNLISAAVYAAKGCKEEAKKRAIEGTVDLVMDVATVVTAGAASAMSTGVKVVAKTGMKLASKAGMNAVKSSFKSAAKAALKSTVKGYANPVKGALKEIKDVGKTVFGMAKGLHKGGKSAVKKISKKVSKHRSKSVKSASDAAEQGAELRRAQGSSAQSNSMRKPDAPVRCKRSGECPLPKSGKYHDEVEGAAARGIGLMKKANEMAEGVKRASRHLMQQFMNSRKQFSAFVDEIRDKFGKTVRGKFKNTERVYLDVSGEATSNKKIFEAFQQHRAVDPSQSIEVYVKQNIGQQDVYFRMLPQEKIRRNTKGQFLIEVLDTGSGHFKAGKYVDMAKSLDDFAKTPARRKEVAQAMLDAVGNARRNQPDFSKVFQGADSAKARAAAVDWIIITQTAEAATGNLAKKIGRIDGMDAYVLKQLRAMAREPETITFGHLRKTMFSADVGGLQTARNGVMGGDNAMSSALDALKRNGGEDSMVDMAKAMSDRK